MATIFGLLQDYYVGSANTRQTSVDLGTFTSCRVYPGSSGPFTFAKRRPRLPSVPCTRQDNRAIASGTAKAWCRLRASKVLGGHLLDKFLILQYSRRPLLASRHEQIKRCCLIAVAHSILTGHVFAKRCESKRTARLIFTDTLRAVSCPLLPEPPVRTFSVGRLSVNPQRHNASLSYSRPYNLAPFRTIPPPLPSSRAGL